MDSQPLIFDISSDEEFGFDNPSTNEDLDWIAKLLEDVADAPDSNPEEVDLKNVEIDKVTNINVVDDDDDDVVVVGEVIVKPKGVKRSYSMMNNSGGDDGDDDDCVVLEFDPDKPPPSKVDDDEAKKCDDDDDDELVVVGEKGQVACRDFPHSRHLCANFPFSSTSHESRCELCHCYVCDSLAPCAHWGSGASTTDHCHATDKLLYWQTERKKFRQSKNPSAPISKPTVSLGPFQYGQPSARPSNPRVASTCSGPVPFGVPNIVSQGRTQRPYVALARDGYQRHLVSQNLLRVRSSDMQGNRVAQLAPRTTASLPILKRHGRYGVSNCAALTWQDSDNLAATSMDNTSANLQGSSSRLVRNPVFRQSNTRTLPSQMPRYGLPNPQTPTSPFLSCGQPAALVCDNQYANASLHQAQSISSPLIPCNTSNALKKAFQSSQQHPVEAQNVSVPDFLVPTSNMPANIPQKSHQALGVLQCLSSTPPSSLNPPNSLETGPHDFLLNVEKDSESGLHFDVERWLDETVGEGFDMSVAPQTSPIDTGMLYFDFETSWQGLAHS